MSKEPNRHQLSSRLAYQANTPSFLLKLQRQHGMAKRGDDDDDDDPEYEYDGSGRPPIPRRPAIPERPEGEEGSEGEDDDSEKPQVVVLRQGKHLTEWEAENERRKAKGLPPLPEPSAADTKSKEDPQKAGSSATAPKQSSTQGLSFSSGAGAKGKNAKRKAVGDGRDDAADPKPQTTAKGSKKKAKKQDKKLLSFGDEA
ncbi:hypothetical protein C2E23DRAFT_741583 [Lenzites betulinus]|nr:hypothetical protein C2E23DRAFT_741583 [Lenzites betulinus]